MNIEKQTILKFLASCRGHNLGGHGEKILLAVSGGSDSVALLALASKLKNKCAVAYIDHRLRKSSVKEKAFVKKLAKQFGMAFHSGSFNVAKAAAAPGKSLEDCAREARYRLLAGICREKGFDRIFTGHTMSDNTETFFLKLLRGGGLRSFYGIARKTEIFGAAVGRPLLDFKREELKKFLTVSKLPFVTDESNRDKKFLRNRIRIDLIPFIEKHFGKSALKHLRALEDQAADLNELVQEVSAELGEKSKNGQLDNGGYLSYNRFLRKCFLADFLGGKANSRHIDRIDGFIASGKGGVFEFRDFDLVVKKGRMCKRAKK
jgi:tRNA(Ile)-lysidine synthase